MNEKPQFAPWPPPEEKHSPYCPICDNTNTGGDICADCADDQAIIGYEEWAGTYCKTTGCNRPCLGDYCSRCRTERADYRARAAGGELYLQNAEWEQSIREDSYTLPLPSRL